MKNKYLMSLLMVFVISLFANNLFAQGAYVNINTGYGINLSSSTTENYSSTSTNIPTYSYSSTSEAVNFSLGKGLNFGGAFGYMFNENIGSELGISYLLGGKTKTVYKYTSGTTHSTTDYAMYSNMLRFNPSLVVASGLEGINPYAKFGLVIGTGSVFSEYVDNDDGDITIEKWKYNGGLAFGINAGVGALFNINDNIAFWGEINMVNLSYAPTKGKCTEATYNGKDELPDMTTSEKEIEFVDSYTYSSTNPPPDSEPDKELKYKMPFGSFGINIGLRVSF